MPPSSPRAPEDQGQRLSSSRQPLAPSRRPTRKALPSPAASLHVTGLPPLRPPVTPLRRFSDASSALPFWHATLDAWSTSDPSQARHISTVRSFMQNGIPVDPNPLPTDRQFPNTSSVKEHATACRERIAYFSDMGAVSRVTRSALSAVHPLHVVVRPGKKPRLVLDLSKNLNDLLTVPHLRMSASVDSAVAMSSPGCWFAKLDISDCFLSFSIAKDATRHLGFQFEGQLYRFDRMPLGLSTASSHCETLLSVVSWLLTSRGVKHVRYCDDILIVGRSRADCASMTDIALATLDQFGFAVAASKTVHATQRIEFLGVDIDSIACVVAALHDVCRNYAGYSPSTSRTPLFVPFALSSHSSANYPSLLTCFLAPAHSSATSSIYAAGGAAV